MLRGRAVHTVPDVPSWTWNPKILRLHDDPSRAYRHGLGRRMRRDRQLSTALSTRLLAALGELEC